MDKSRNAAAGRLRRRVSELDLQPLSARSVVLSALLGTHPPVMPVAALVALAARFGVSPGALRTALSRMVAGGELIADDGRYELTGRLLERQREQDLGRRRPTDDWDGTWWVVNALGARRTAAERRRFRSVTEGGKLAELRPDTWMRPANVEVGPELPDLIVSRGRLATATSIRLVAELWDIGASEHRATELAAALELVDEALGGGPAGTDTVTDAVTDARPHEREEPPDDTEPGAVENDVIAPAFTVLAACLRFLRVEPQLPDALAATPAGDGLRRRYAAVEAKVQRELRAVYRVAMRAAGTSADRQ